jgi:5-methylcytosine-specific restriction endonuclease McrA
MITKIRTTAGRLAHDARPGRESLGKRLGRVARQIKARDDHRCVYCGSDGAGAHLHLDHLTPRAHGGADVATNLVVSCRRCNTARKTLSLAQWSAYAAEVYGLSFTPAQIRGRARRRLPDIRRAA